ncbi:SDR family oxidoreductase [Staphylococcus devriesei]|uniref:SDR family NAD(P)-dependent oxidoreductase n=1 Tax=Staphylococcus devriesei TaxID=586733 RepID=A0A2K4DQ82_9STAP|nr:SDR family oxidoreductase [Staphylococcus devriesei]MCE5090239.1 SDR family oxidoreductase [Staphylococcus devriesei]MCE5096955.1 SDR family oxidoreductase [Staphylococcus devriesei]PNZ88961.1 oxidoreductase [Staphylococcus devriesei]PTE71570.1 SDR family NAD(P)-dependent oxidoreductase [Staphylococcus devriesei]PTF04812.1 SDR family NAD(P)-dependent oxidoreductase [Staphylococcus devriesei]
MAELNERVAIITGASSGIGATTAKTLAHQGVKVVLAGRNEDKLQEVASDMAEGDYLITPTDITSKDEVDALVENAVAKFKQVDILVNCAGINGSSKITDYDVETWDSMIDTNVKGLLYSLNAVLPHFEEQGSGHIINLASISGFEVSKDSALYSASKSAVLRIVEALEKELARTGIKSTSILPGMVDTPMTENSDFGGRKKLDPEDIANAVIYALTQPDHVNVNEVIVRPV